MSILQNACLLAGTLSIDTPDPFALASRAAAAYDAGNYAEAADHYREIVAIVPGSPGALNGLGRSLAHLGRTAEALEWLGRAADTGAGTDLAAVQAAFGASVDAPEVRALLSRLRGNATPIVSSTLAFRLAEKDLLPESVGYDPADGAWYVGSLRKRKIIVLRDGVARDFDSAKAHGLGAVLGIKVDAGRRQLWANSCHGDDPPAIVGPRAAASGRDGCLSLRAADRQASRRSSAGKPSAARLLQRSGAHSGWRGVSILGHERRVPRLADHGPPRALCRDAGPLRQRHRRLRGRAPALPG